VVAAEVVVVAVLEASVLELEGEPVVVAELLVEVWVVVGPPVVPWEVPGPVPPVVSEEQAPSRVTAMTAAMPAARSKYTSLICTLKFRKVPSVMAARRMFATESHHVH
jgi:hypothetical protein